MHSEQRCPRHPSLLPAVEEVFKGPEEARQCSASDVSAHGEGGLLPVAARGVSNPPTPWRCPCHTFRVEQNDREGCCLEAEFGEVVGIFFGGDSYVQGYACWILLEIAI